MTDVSLYCYKQASRTALATTIEFLYTRMGITLPQPQNIA